MSYLEFNMLNLPIKALLIFGFGCTNSYLLAQKNLQLEVLNITDALIDEHKGLHASR